HWGCEMEVFLSSRISLNCERREKPPFRCL
ncbi:hypothetical protein VC95412_002855B, partial [Vibrio cholerae O1 str. 95412]